MESAAVPAGGSQAGDKGLKKNAIGYITNVVIGVASTAPGYSIAATLGFVVAVSGIGLQAPAVMLVAFIPMFFIAFAYRYMNRADPDCGTTFTWATRALGPGAGWLSGWAIILTDVIVMASLAQIAAIYTFLLFDWKSAAASHGAVLIAGVIWIVLMTLICYLGTELSARTQQVLLTIEIFTLTLFAVWAIAKVYIDNPAHSLHVQADWFNPFSVDSFSSLVNGVLIGVFIYWGWDSGVAVNEESEDSAEGPGKSAIVSTLLLLGIYLIISAAAQAYAGPQFLIKNQSDVLSTLGNAVFGNALLAKLLIITVLTSASASTQTTILPTARTTLSMARQKAFPKRFGNIHPRYLTPSFSTLWMGAVSIAWFILIEILSPDNVLGDSVTALGFGIAFYYGITGFACAIYYRRELRRDFKTFFYAGVLPVLGGLLLLGIFVKSFIDLSNPDNTNTAFLGVGAPVVIGVGGLVLGAVLMIFARFSYRDFFSRKPEVFDPATAGQASVMEEN
jgi:amino acid transporter